VLFAPELARGLIRSFCRRHSWPESVSALIVPAQCCRRAGVSGFINIIERPHLLQALASSPYDSEGVATRDRDLVKRWRAAGLRAGQLLGAQARAEDHRQCRRHSQPAGQFGETGSFEQLLRRMGTGLVTELMGQGVNGVTGDYSRGASGFWVENGAIAYPVHEITIAGNLKQMLKTILAVGSDVDAQGSRPHRIDTARGDDNRGRVSGGPRGIEHAACRSLIATMGCSRVSRSIRSLSVSGAVLLPGLIHLTAELTHGRAVCQRWCVSGRDCGCAPPRRFPEMRICVISRAGSRVSSSALVSRSQDFQCVDAGA
jgi:hypothetical protein